VVGVFASTVDVGAAVVAVAASATAAIFGSFPDAVDVPDEHAASAPTAARADSPTTIFLIRTRYPLSGTVDIDDGAGLLNPHWSNRSELTNRVQQGLDRVLTDPNPRIRPSHD
jgi:hypothetical protein